MEEINDVSDDHPSVIKGLFFIISSEETELKFMVISFDLMRNYPVI